MWFVDDVYFIGNIVIKVLDSVCIFYEEGRKCGVKDLFFLGDILEGLFSLVVGELDIFV